MLFYLDIKYFLSFVLNQISLKLILQQIFAKTAKNNFLSTFKLRYIDHIKFFMVSVCRFQVYTAPLSRLLVILKKSIFYMDHEFLMVLSKLPYQYVCKKNLSFFYLLSYDKNLGKYIYKPYHKYKNYYALQDNLIPLQEKSKIFLFKLKLMSIKYQVSYIVLIKNF